MVGKTKIYVLCEPSGKIRYVGKTVRALEKRLYSHLHEARVGEKNHRCNWIRSLFSNGFLPAIQLVGEVDGDGAKEEVAWIKYFRDEGLDLVNGTDGGDGSVGYICSPETRAKLSVANKGLRNRFFGKHHSLESRVKMSVAQKGSRSFMFGKHYSLESRAKMAAAKKGKRMPLETRAKISATKKGEQKSPETRAKMSAARKGKRASLESRAKMTAAKRMWWNERKLKERHK